MIYYVIARFMGAMGPMRWERKRTVTAVYDGATFSTSVLILLGIYDHQVMLLIGDTTPVLGIAGVLGVIHTYNSLFPDE
ncbi:MAG TPA: hypothetical protein VN668_17125 [Stellaceae bacterium]|nr:hypothetical protein [Stellaceae bacterium]